LWCSPDVGIKGLTLICHMLPLVAWHLQVTKLFHIVEPDVAVFGRKDYQQWRVITRMVGLSETAAH
jgi:fructose-bisphosphate aldolase class 1